MGFILPSPDSPVEQARTLTVRKESIEAEIEAQISILKANNSTLHSPLVNPDGFPRDDIDVFLVRGARVRLIELRNDLKAVMDAIAKALERVYDPSLAVDSAPADAPVGPPKPFARVDGVAPGSPASDAVRAIFSFTIIIKTDEATRAILRVSNEKIL